MKFAVLLSLRLLNQKIVVMDLLEAALEGYDLLNELIPIMKS